MNRYHLLSVLLFISGILFVTLGILTGEVHGGLLLIVPFVIGSGIHATLGIFLIITSFFLYMFTISTNLPARGTEYNPIKTNSKIKGGGVILLGPIPIIFGTNWKIALILTAIAIILLLIAYNFLV